MLPLRLRLLKRVDRYVGRFVASRLAPPVIRGGDHDGPVWAPRPVPPQGVRRILVIRPGGIGDAVLTHPMIRALLDHYREATLDVLGERRNAGVFQISRLVHEVQRYDAHPLRVLRRLRARRYDIVIDTEQYHYLSLLWARALRPPNLCGFDNVGRGRLMTHRVNYNERTYEALLFLKLAEALIGRPQSFDVDRPFLEIDPRWQAWAAERLSANGQRPIAVIVPGASTHHKYWPPPRYAAVASWLIRREFFVVILGAADTLETARIVAGSHRPQDVLNLSGQTTIPQSAAIVQRARLYISSDTGLLHVAYGVGTPTVHMFGSGIQEKWAPPGRRYVVVNKGLPCSPCTRYGYTPPCPYNVACMDAIQVQDVTDAIEEVLRR